MASLRRRMQPGSRVLLPPQPPLCRSAHRRLLWSYQLIAELGFERDSWVTPADIRRVRPEEDADLVAIEQVRGLLHRLPEQSISPLFVFDAFSTTPCGCS